MSRDNKGSYNAHSAAREKVMQLRVTELQGFLQACGLSKTGRKDELRHKALSILKSTAQNDSFAQVSARLDEYYHMRFPKTTSSPHHVLASSVLQSQASRHTPSSVRLKPLPFHEKIETLVKPRLLPSFDARNMAPQHLNFEVELSTQQATLLHEGRRTVPPPSSPYGAAASSSEVKYTRQVLVRFAPCELSCEQDDQFPPRCSLTVNRHQVVFPGYQPQKATADVRRHGQPVDATPYLAYRGPNMLQVTCLPAPEQSRNYVVTVELCKRHSAAELLQEVCGRQRSAELCSAFIREKLGSSDPDLEIATTSLRISLSCPLSKTRLVYPGRSSGCTHAQCFDMASYLQMNERKARWVCPVCDQPAEFKTLLIDGLMKEVLEKCPKSVDHIEYLVDGSWVPYHPSAPGQRKAPKGGGTAASSSSGVAVTSMTSPPADAPLVCDLSDSCNSLDIQTGEHAAAAPSRYDVIDLTLDSDSEDDSPDASAAALCASTALASALTGAVSASGSHDSVGSVTSNTPCAPIHSRHDTTESSVSGTAVSGDVDLDMVLDDRGLNNVFQFGASLSSHASSMLSGAASASYNPSNMYLGNLGSQNNALWPDTGQSGMSGRSRDMSSAWPFVNEQIPGLDGDQLSTMAPDFGSVMQQPPAPSSSYPPPHQYPLSTYGSGLGSSSSFQLFSPPRPSAGSGTGETSSPQLYSDALYMPGATTRTTGGLAPHPFPH